MLIQNSNEYDTTRYAAEIMSRLRPDIFPFEHALVTLRNWIENLDNKESGYSIGTGGFQIIKWIDGDGVTAYELMLKLADWDWFKEGDGSVDFAGTIWKAEWVKTPIEEVA